MTANVVNLNFASGYVGSYAASRSADSAVASAPGQVSSSTERNTDTLDITRMARDMETAYQTVKSDANQFDDQLISSIRDRLANVPIMSDALAEVLAEKIIKGYA